MIEELLELGKFSEADLDKLSIFNAGDQLEDFADNGKPNQDAEKY